MSRKLSESPTVRCAIYTRKSTEEGLEQEFNSLDAQRESAEAYIKSQQHEGWHCLPDRYDDGGFTGGNMERPFVRHSRASLLASVIHHVPRIQPFSRNHWTAARDSSAALLMSSLRLIFSR
jgi:site-specific DNA recombinase